MLLKKINTKTKVVSDQKWPIIIINSARRENKLTMCGKKGVGGTFSIVFEI